MGTPVMPTFNTPELVDIVIDHLHADRPSLIACSLVSKQWFPSSRYHLFASVELSLPSPRCIQFLNLLDSPLTTIRPHVRALTLINYRPLDKNIARLSDHLIAINSVTLTLMYRPPGFQTASFPFQRITCLHLNLSFLSTEDDVVDLINSYPFLEELSMMGVHCDSPSSRALKLPSSLRVIRTDWTPGPLEPTPGMLADVLSGRQKLPALDTVGMRIVPDNITALGVFLRDLESQLRNLELWIGSKCNLDQIGSAINLEHNTRLESIVIHPFENYMSESIVVYSMPQLSQFSYIPRLISQIKSPLIELIEFSVSSLTVEELSQWSVLHSLEHVLSGPQFAQLRRLSLRVRRSFSRKQCMDIRQRMPMCDKRGILVFRS